MGRAQSSSENSPGPPQIEQRPWPDIITRFPLNTPERHSSLPIDFCKLCHGPSLFNQVCVHVYYDICSGGCNASVMAPPPTCTPSAGQGMLAQCRPLRDLTRASSLRPQLFLRPVMNAAVLGHWAWASRPGGLWGKQRTLTSAVIGGNWKLSVPVGHAAGL